MVSQEKQIDVHPMPEAVSIFDAALERHPRKEDPYAKIGEVAQKFSDGEADEEAVRRVCREARDQKKMSLYVGNHLVSKDRDLFWLQRGTERMVHEYNINLDSGTLVFRMEASPEMNKKLGKKLGSWEYEYKGRTEVWYHLGSLEDLKDAANGQWGVQHMIYYPKEGFIEFGASYKLEKETEAISKMRETVAWAGNIVGRLDTEELC